MRTCNDSILIHQKLILGLKNKLNKLDQNASKIIISYLIENPSYISSGIILMRALKKSKKTRVTHLKMGIMVPPALILSITSQCNLGCIGCFAAATGVVNQKNKNELTLEQWHSIIKEAKDLGVFCFVIAGGEPFLYKNLISICKKNHDRFFVILTNGTTVDEKIITEFDSIRNTVILVSIEGGKKLTDSRRGEGIYDKAMNFIHKLNEKKIPCGISITITRENYQYWMNGKNIDLFIEKGIKIGVFIEYIPTTYKNCNKKSNECVMLTSGERKVFRERILDFRKTKSLFIIHSPGDEE